MNNWISIYDRLPDDGQDVIYYFEPVGMHIGKFEYPNIFYGKAGVLCDDVTHWMPRPNPPISKHQLLFIIMGLENKLHNPMTPLSDFEIFKIQMEIKDLKKELEYAS